MKKTQKLCRRLLCTGRYGITFPQLSKLDVLGPNADPLFKYLSESTTFIYKTAHFMNT